MVTCPVSRRFAQRLCVPSALLALCVSTPAQDPTPLAASDAQLFDFFGKQVAAAEDLLVVAAPFVDVDDVFNVGKLYVYEPDGARWQQVAELTAPEGGLNDRLGQALDTDGQRIVAGSRAVHGGMPEAGAVDVFVREAGSWVHEARLKPAEPQFNGRFGLEVAVDGDTIAVGAPNHDVPFENEGEVWMYERGPAGWRLAQVLTAPVPSEEAFFGQAVDVQGDRLVIGAPAESQGGFAEGGAYVFERRDREWLQTAHLALPEPWHYDQFGWSVAVDGDRVAVGAPWTDVHGNASGEVRVFTFAEGAWRRLDRVFSPTPEPDDHFGRALALDGDLLAVSELDPPSALQAGVGTVQLFRWDGVEFAPIGSYEAPLAPVPGGFANSIALSDGRLLSGSPEDSTVEMQAGAAWVYETP